jgi:1,4-dihydroxy-2-naphthoate octaprenyltransferase
VAVRFGRMCSRIEFVALLSFAYLAPFWLWRGLGFSIWVLLPLLTLPVAIIVTCTIWNRSRFVELVPMTPRMAMLTVGYAVCLAIGLAVGV